MAECDESVSLNDRYESLKVLCREQILANEILKNELGRLRKCFGDIERHRIFLLDKLLADNRSQPMDDKIAFKKKHKPFAVTSEEIRSSCTQKSNESCSPSMARVNNERNEINLKFVSTEVPLRDESDSNTDSSFDSDWEPHANAPEFGKSLKRKQHISSSTTSGFSHKRALRINQGATTLMKSFSSNRLDSSKKYKNCSPELVNSPVDEDVDVEPPEIYSIAKNTNKSSSSFGQNRTPSAQSVHVSSRLPGYPSSVMNQKNSQRLVGSRQFVPAILKQSSSTSAFGINSATRVYINKTQNNTFMEPPMF